jgi:hypothetical protein
MKGLGTTIIFFVAALVTAIGFSARADTRNKLSILTFSQDTRGVQTIVRSQGGRHTPDP